MWIAIRLLLFMIGFAVRQLGRSFDFGVENHGGHYVKLRKNKQRITGFSIGMACPSPAWIRMHAESDLDRWVKRLGIAEELQTGDATFDSTVYLSCDHAGVVVRLRQSAKLREAILDAFGAGFQRIRFDGDKVWLDRGADGPPGHQDFATLDRLQQASELLGRPYSSQLRDPFLWKAFAVEGLVWGLLGHTLGILPELLAERTDYHLSPSAMIPAAGLVTVATFAFLVLLVATWMRGSSRGHRVLVESAVVLAVALPITSFQVVADTNRALDEGVPQTTRYDVTRCEQRVRRSRRGTRRSYHIHLAPAPGSSGPLLPSTIRVEEGLCIDADAGRFVEVTVSPGRWGHPWIRKMRTHVRTWTAP